MLKKSDSLLNGSPSKKQESLAPNESDLSLRDPAQKEDSSTSASEHPAIPESHSALVTSPRRPSESGPASPISNLPTATVPRNPIQAELLKRPLLNLTSPANGDDNESDVATGSPLTSPKKKRKRRKKKKHPMTEAEYSSTATASAAPNSTVVPGAQA